MTPLSFQPTPHPTLAASNTDPSPQRPLSSLHGAIDGGVGQRSEQQPVPPSRQPAQDDGDGDGDRRGQLGSELYANNASALAPLALPTYRMLWVASLFSNTGTWMHEVGAGWLMSTLDGSPQMVSAVRAATALPMLFLAIPAGALSDRVDRRRLLLVVQCLLMTTAATLTLLTYMHWINPVTLLLLTVLMGVGAVMHVPTWQASIPEIVPRKHLPQAIALGSISFNLARSVGPAMGGLLIATIGTWAAFGFNALSFTVVLLAIYCWRRQRVTPTPVESYWQSMRAGVALAVGRSGLRRVLLWLGLFVLPSSSVWALLPLVARHQLNWDAQGYGYLVGAIGIGAVLIALGLPRLRARLGVETTLATFMLLYAASLILIGLTEDRGVALSAAVVLGAGWMAVLTTLNAIAQLSLGDAVRARGMASYLSVMAMAMTIGSITWGQVAAWQSPAAALVISGAVLAMVGVAAGARLGGWKPPGRRLRTRLLGRLAAGRTGATA